MGLWPTLQPSLALLLTWLLKKTLDLVIINIYIHYEYAKYIYKNTCLHLSFPSLSSLRGVKVGKKKGGKKENEKKHLKWISFVYRVLCNICWKPIILLLKHFYSFLQGKDNGFFCVTYIPSISKNFAFLQGLFISYGRNKFAWGWGQGTDTKNNRPNRRTKRISREE